MFGGIVAGTGKIIHMENLPEAMRLTVDCAVLFNGSVGPAIGSSVSVSGVCLTVGQLKEKQARFDMSSETLQRTTASDWREGMEVNLEAAIRLGDELGGHWLTGHVDGTGRILAYKGEGPNKNIQIETPPDIMRFVATKGSIAVDGVSLTVNGITAGSFAVMLIPTTLRRTIAENYSVGRKVNLEADILARYAARALHAENIKNL